MVFIAPAVAALSLSLAGSYVAALPAQAAMGSSSAMASATPPASPSKSPMSIEPRPMGKRNQFIGGGSGMKTIRQAPLMKPQRLIKAKKSTIIQPRDNSHEHIHIHEHDHDHDHHHSGKYDPHHSEHWNYHHGNIDDDKHHHHSRSLLNVQALNLGGPAGGWWRNGHNKSDDHKKTEETTRKTTYYDHAKRQLDSVTELIGKASKGKGKEPAHSGSKGMKKKPAGIHSKSKGSTKASEKKHKGGKRSHDHDHEHSHVHAHIHEHHHKRDHTEHSAHWYEHHAKDHHADHVHDHDHDHEHVHEHIHDERDHDGHSDHWYEHHKLDRHDHDHEHVHVHKHVHDKRDLVSSGVPGFVEVASTLFHSSLAKSMAGLVFSKDPQSNSSDFVLGTSDSQSTQFYLAPVDLQPKGDGQNAYGVSFAVVGGDNSGNITDASLGSASPEAAVAMYQLRIPVLDSQSLKTNDYCATFDVQPPSPLSMQPCGGIDGFSQIFGYNASTGELTPIYPATAANPTPLNAAVRLADPSAAKMLAASMPASSDSTASGSSTMMASMNSTATATSTSSSVASPSWTATASTEAPPKVALYFIPSSGFYSDADSVESLTAPKDPSMVASDIVSSITSAADAIVATPTSAPALPLFTANAKMAMVKDDSFSDDADNEDSDDVYTTVTITTTVSAASSGPTSTSSSYDSETFDGSSGRNNAVIADAPESDSSYTANDSSATSSAVNDDTATQDGSDANGAAQATPTSNW